MTGIELITKERRDQLEKKGYKPEDDAAYYNEGQLVEAAFGLVSHDYYSGPPENWNVAWWNHTKRKPLVERLAIAGSFLAAEIDRLEYIKNNGKNITSENNI